MKSALFALSTLLLALPALADSVKVDAPWVRATAPGQKVAGAFMELTADADMTLVGGESPAARVVELHTMSMENGVMVMRPLKDIALPRGKTVQLKPGGLHVMLIDLKGQIKEGEQTPLTLTVRGADGRQQRLSVQLEAQRAGGQRQHMMH
jgi:copper(I)-binding protein